jgi:hypothetical protein
MSEYRDIITLNKNARGCYILDTVKGCSYLQKNPRGCYGDCYANNIATRYGFDFSIPVKRDFIKQRGQIYFDGFADEKHECEIIRQAKNADMPFIRIGEMGDPSESWEHTVSVCKTIARSKKKIVIITKHWKTIPENIITELEKIDVCINTSISAMDSEDQIRNRIQQGDRLADYCNSVLRVVTCDFNTATTQGGKMKLIQDKLLERKHIDTVFRPNKNNDLVISKTINIEKIKFLRGDVLASMHNKNIWFGMCSQCPDMCGINV